MKKLKQNLKDLKHEKNQIEINGVQYQKLQSDKSRVEDENKHLQNKLELLSVQSLPQLEAEMAKDKEKMMLYKL